MTTPEFASNRDNFCYRHPGRQSFVLCQRCMRTICPECQTQGPVGVICPECMKAQRKAQSPAQKHANRRWGGGAVAMAGRSGRPMVTYVLLAITSAIGLLQRFPASAARSPSSCGSGPPTSTPISRVRRSSPGACSPCSSCTAGSSTSR
ncbi:hypothetical protein [Microbacterium suwonense]|uniref:B box-type domain-containing protein n=1 Tax=Microbacterium suwonense TaxID=683047 RepID=A0ABM8FW34_9MICO|nr:hypothetical protein GCM10025863_25110 [Microbacterium suwonense]